MDTHPAARPIDGAARDRIRTLAERLHGATGIAPLGEAAWRDLDHPDPGSFVMEDRDAIVHAMRRPGAWVLGVVPALDPTAPRPPIGAALSAAVDRGDDPVTLWIAGADRPTAHRMIEDAASCGLECARRLLRLEVALPVAGRPLPDGVVISDFVDPDDVAAWLDVNNRAFDAHPEQGGWDRATFDARRSEAWFRAEDLRIARLEGRVVGSCWTKRTDDPGRPPIGEIYVIGVDPSTQGLGLGPALVADGLDHLARRCGAEIGMLYVDAANAPAVAMYGRLGFRQVREDHAYATVPR